MITRSQPPQRFRPTRSQARAAMLLALPVMLVSLLLILATPTIAQDATATVTPTIEMPDSDETPDAGATQIALDAIQTSEAQFVQDAAATQIVMDATGTADAIATQTAEAQIAATATTGFIATQTRDAQIAATATQGFFGTQTAIAPRPTSVFQPITIFIIEPRTNSTTYSIDDEIKVTVRITNIGETPEDRALTVVATYDTKLFKAPVESSISSDGKLDGNTITWHMTSPLATGETNAHDFSFRTTVRSDLTESGKGTIQASVVNQGGVLLAQTEALRISVEVRDVPREATSTDVPQGEGLFQDAGSFALLIGLFFGLGALMVFGLSALVIYRSQDDESKEQTFNNTVEIALLLIVLFSVIIMGVQNAIDRESINAIIGGIVGYVAGRVRARMPSGTLRARPPEPTHRTPETAQPPAVAPSTKVPPAAAPEDNTNVT